MKKVLLFVMLLSSVSAFAQAEKDVLKHEVKVNGLLLIFGFPEISYEHILAEDMSIGASFAFRVTDEDETGIYQRVSFSPYYRIFFGKKPAAGFFVEGFGSIYSSDSYSFSNDRETYMGTALGIGLGVKFLTNSNWIGEISLGAARNFSNTDNIMEVIGRGGIMIGKRF